MSCAEHDFLHSGKWDVPVPTLVTLLLCAKVHDVGDFLSRKKKGGWVCG